LGGCIRRGAKSMGPLPFSAGRKRQRRRSSSSSPPAPGQKTFVIGEKPSDANLVKLSGNFLIAATIESLGEAIALARKSGIDAHRYVEILTGTLFSAPVYNNYGAIIADETYEPAGFKMTLGFNDIRLALAAAEALHVPMPIASLVRDHFLCGLARGEGDK
jgi:3-hydroxyisobutyrate dehydrogenase-like beta-hydroxyacid dehydrogenase